MWTSESYYRKGQFSQSRERKLSRLKKPQKSSCSNQLSMNLSADVDIT